MLTIVFYFTAVCLFVLSHFLMKEGRTRTLVKYAIYIVLIVPSSIYLARQFLSDDSILLLLIISMALAIGGMLILKGFIAVFSKS